MIDINLIRENPELVKKSMKKRLLDEKIVSDLINLDKEWRKLKKQTDELRARRNKVSKEINKAKKQRKSPKNLIKEAKQIPEKLKNKLDNLREIQEKRLSLWRNIPNIVDKNVPAGDESKNKEIKKYGKKTKKIKQGHAELMEKYNLIDTKKASQISGTRFYYLKNQLVKLNFALINFALDYLIKKDFQPVQTPYMLNKKALQGAITLDAFQESIYKIQDEDLYLIGTAEHAINALNSDEILDLKKPLRFVGFSTNFRKEAGSHGKDTKGIFRTHQFDKIEQFVFSHPNNAKKEFNLILNNSIEIYKKLGIPFRTVLLAAGDVSKTATKTIDLQGWFPSQQKYRELGSCSNCLDYQARRANIRYQQENEMKFCYTLNNTAIATQRMMTCIVENNIQKSGKIKIPSCLHKYTGFKEILPDKKEKK